jgi:hypothetical protein
MRLGAGSGDVPTTRTTRGCTLGANPPRSVRPSISTTSPRRRVSQEPADAGVAGGTMNWPSLPSWMIRLWSSRSSM